MDIDEIKDGLIHYFINGVKSFEEGFTLDEIKKFLRVNNVLDYAQEMDGLDNLSPLLADMKSDDLIEEKDNIGVIYYDYSGDGMARINGRNEELDMIWITQLGDDNCNDSGLVDSSSDDSSNEEEFLQEADEVDNYSKKNNELIYNEE